MTSQDENIDAVITWVDGADPVHREKRLKALKESDSTEVNTLPSGADITRFSNNDEIKYCIRSIVKFAPWINNIYIITDNQRPAFLTDDYMEANNIKIIDHKEIFKGFEWALPTFNTRTIETGLWRIPGLAERFIYFNDDFVLSAKAEPRDFFQGNNSVIQGTWHKISDYGPFRMKINELFSKFTKKLFGITRSMHTLLQIRSAQLAGFEDRYYFIPHVPHPVHTETIRSFFEENPKLFEHNIKYPFRSTDQFSAIFLANYLDIKNHRAILKKNKQAMMIHGEMDPGFLLNYKLRRVKNKKVKYVCLQAMESFRPAQQKLIEETLSAHI